MASDDLNIHLSRCPLRYFEHTTLLVLLSHYFLQCGFRLMQWDWRKRFVLGLCTYVYDVCVQPCITFFEVLGHPNLRCFKYLNRLHYENWGSHSGVVENWNSGIWLHVDWSIVTDVSETPSASISPSLTTLKMEIAYSSETSVNIYQLIGVISQKNWNFELHCIWTASIEVLFVCSARASTNIQLRRVWDDDQYVITQQHRVTAYSSCSGMTCHSISGSTVLAEVRFLISERPDWQNVTTCQPVTLMLVLFKLLHKLITKMPK
jgi:hypothetical protein